MLSMPSIAFLQFSMKVDYLLVFDDEEDWIAVVVAIYKHMMVACIDVEFFACRQTPALAIVLLSLLCALPGQIVVCAELIG